MALASQDSRLLARALDAHQRGRLEEADRLYRQILRDAPAHFEAQHYCGILRHQQGRSAEALALIAGALKVQPQSAQALSNQGLVLYALRRFDEALASF